MGWTIIVENENGQMIERLSNEFSLSNQVFIAGDFKLLKYLDPYGDTTFNSLMIDDLVSDLIMIKNSIPKQVEQIDNVIELALTCKQNVHTYLKFYGD